MPVAIPFSAKGAYNDGFQHCLRESVASYDKWTTLGGYNKDSACRPYSSSNRIVDTGGSQAILLLFRV